MKQRPTTSPRNRILKQALLCGIGLGLSISSFYAPQAQAREYRYTDSHLHYVDFLQYSQGMQALLRQMDKSKVDYAQIMGLGVVKKWQEDEPQKPQYLMADDARVYWYSATDELVARAVEQLSASQRARFFPFITGFNPTDMNAVDHIERMLTWHPGLFKGIGEVLLRHDDLTALTYGETPRANNKAMDRVYSLAAKHHLPVLIHSNITSVYHPDPIYRKELEEAVSRHPDTTFIWAHAGTSEAINREQYLKFLPSLVSEFLQRYDNLYIDLSWSVLHPYILDDKNKPRGEWLSLIRKYPQRFTIGSDLIGYFDALGSTLEDYNPLLDALPTEVANDLARDNFLRLMGVSPR
ncbi:5-oxo-L-prolinase [Pokkaliibacter plantistimulans]|uniref:5-oxo-L-prolinase n=1 Tax=Proteobacteria bacterium 228 TaxID=2083153 RepID=A0A2S5KMY5_9PROT|nr:amidohydrolase family protein [Pokkaliibacter plantistimulans]PPC76100.1 5-oxo-L-prolinase [Pokkaliibacter plantistimulans]